MTYLRQPIVSVLGHVDHGKTSVLDWIRGTSVVNREAGAITQHIGATEVPMDAITRICGKLMAGKSFEVPGLLFIDTPGHHSFTTLRSRGGALSDLAVLVVDVRDSTKGGSVVLKPQTVESIRILKQYKTPFIIAANKIDLVHEWKWDKSNKQNILPLVLREQSQEFLENLDESVYGVVGALAEHDVPAERYDRIADFSKQFAIVPISAKFGIGLPDLLMILVGLAQRYQAEALKTEEGPGVATILEVKEEKGLGTTLDVILSDGVIRKGDEIAVGSVNPYVTRVKAIFKPKALDEIRDAGDRFFPQEEVAAACGIKISLQDSQPGVASGQDLRVVTPETEDEILDELKEEGSFSIVPDEDGIVIAADAVGSLEALMFELKALEVPVFQAKLGDISRRDVVDVATRVNPLQRIILCFNVKTNQDATEELGGVDVKVLQSDVVYKLTEDYTEWKRAKLDEIEKNKRGRIVFPGKLRIIPEYIFRKNKPAVVGVRVLGGRLVVGHGLVRTDGKRVGAIKSIRDGEESVKEAIVGKEVAISISDCTVGRQVKPDDILLVDIPERDAKALQKMDDLSTDDNDILHETLRAKRQVEPTYGFPQA